MNKNYSYALMFVGFIVLRKLFDKSLLVGIAVGMLLSFFILKGNIVESISNFAGLTDFTENIPDYFERMGHSAEKSNSNSKLSNTIIRFYKSTFYIKVYYNNFNTFCYCRNMEIR